MTNEEILRREEAERRAYQEIGAHGRSAREDKDLVLDPDDVARYRSVAEGRAPVRTPLEQMIVWAFPLAGKSVLEVCGHDGEYATLLALLGATVTSVDIAEPLVEQARRRAAMNGVTDRLTARVMSVHEMEFEDNAFDLVFGKAALHHLDLNLSSHEIFRVMKPGGSGVFSEPVELSRGLGQLRKLIPVKVDRETPDERQLTRADLETFTAPFGHTENAYFRMFSRLQRVIPGAYSRLCDWDARLLQRFPSLEKWAGTCVFRVSK